MDKIIEIKDMDKIYHVLSGEIVAIKNFDLDVYEGEMLAIVGPSGCGKSTLLSILCGLEKNSSGIINFDNSLKFGYMLQQDCLFDWRNILDNCLLGLEINHNLNDVTREKVMYLLKKYGLEDFLYRYPKELSGGMRQRVALIRTLANDPDVLLLDEPFSALDYQTRLAVSDDVYKIIKNEHKTVIMVTHDLAEAISMADRVVVLSNRPSSVKKIFNIELSNKTTPINNRKCLEFKDYYDAIWKEIDYHV